MKRTFFLTACGAFAFAASAGAASAQDLQFCEVPDPTLPESAFEIWHSEKSATGDYWVSYSCKTPCDDWRQCVVPSHSERGRPLMYRDRPKRGLAFVVDGLGGHFSYTEGHAGEETAFIHTGMGGTAFWGASTSRGLEDRSDMGTVTVRWEDGFVDHSVRGFFRPAWGWYSRTSPEPASVPELNKRVAAAISWAHDNIAGPGKFATVGCSMGAQATYSAVYWHGIDDIVDYQLFMGGPPLWDINASCGRRVYETGYCDADGTSACGSDADCAHLGEYANCLIMEPLPVSPLLESVVNHVHGGVEECRPEKIGASAGPYAPFDESGLGFAEGDTDFDHPVDFIVDFHRSDTSSAIGGNGDENWGGAQFPPAYLAVESSAGHPKQWLVSYNSSHCAGWNNGNAVNTVLAGLGLE